VLTTAGELAIFKGASQLAITSGLGIVIDVWKTLELHVFADATSGAYTLKLDGATILSATNVNTVASSNAYYTAVRLGPTGSSFSYSAFDDVYIRDDSTFLLDWRITTMLPTSDAGPNDGTPSAGSDNFAMVDDAAPDGDSTYIDSDAASLTAITSTLRRWPILARVMRKPSARPITSREARFLRITRTRRQRG